MFIVFAMMISLVPVTAVAGTVSPAVSEKYTVTTVVEPTAFMWIHNWGMPFGYTTVSYGGTYAVMNHKGEIIIPFGEYGYIEGVAGDRNDYLKTTKGGSLGIIDFSGNIILPFEYGGWPVYSEGMFIISNGKGRGIVNKSNEAVVPFGKYVAINSFFDGLSRVYIRENGITNWGYINTDGEEIIPTIYDSATNFNNGAARVGLNGESFFINTSGERVEPPVIAKPPVFDFDWVDSFHDGLAIDPKDWKSGFINQNGEAIVPLGEYDDMLHFREGYAAVQKGGGFEHRTWGFINTSGEVVIPIIYNNVQSFHEGFAVVGNGFWWENANDWERFTGKHGVIDKDGDVVIAVEYEDIRRIGGVDGAEYFWVKQDGLWKLLAISRNTPTQTKTLPNFIAPIEIIADKSDRIAISDRAGLEAIADNLSGNFYLTNDIDLGGKEWTPIGNMKNPFTGAFDGQGHTIRNMTITAFNNKIGLFGVAENATIRNVGLEDTNIDNNGENIWIYNVGSIVGGMDKCLISNVYNTGNINIKSNKISPAYVGGIVGSIIVSSTIINSYNTADITVDGCGEMVAGGIVSAVWSSSNISNSFNTGNVTAVSNNYYAFAGGIAGEINRATTITACFNTGDVSAAGRSWIRAGGIFAVYEHGGFLVSDCYNTGNVTATGDMPCDLPLANGIYDDEYKSVLNSYNTGNVTDIRTHGSHRPQTRNFIQDNGVITPLTTAQMQQQSSFVGFDFDNTWTFLDGMNNGMPVLRVFERMYTPPQPKITLTLPDWVCAETGFDFGTVKAWREIPTGIPCVTHCNTIGSTPPQIVSATVTSGGNLSAEISGENADSFSFWAFPINSQELFMNIIFLGGGGAPGARTATVTVTAACDNGNILATESFNLSYKVEGAAERPSWPAIRRVGGVPIICSFGRTNMEDISVTSIKKSHTTENGFLLVVEGSAVSPNRLPSIDVKSLDVQDDVVYLELRDYNTNVGNIGSPIETWRVTFEISNELSGREIIINGVSRAVNTGDVLCPSCGEPGNCDGGYCDSCMPCDSCQLCGGSERCNSGNHCADCVMCGCGVATGCVVCTKSDCSCIDKCSVCYESWCVCGVATGCVVCTKSDCSCIDKCSVCYESWCVCGVATGCVVCTKSDCICNCTDCGNYDCDCTKTPPTRNADIFDVLDILKSIVGMIPPLPLEIYDFDNNGKVDIFDALEVLKGLTGIIERVTLPY
jgi:hypothetical protein